MVKCNLSGTLPPLKKMVWEAQVVIKGGSLCSRERATASNSGSGTGKGKLYALRRRFVVVVDAKAVSVKVLGSATPWWSTTTPLQVVVKKRLVKIVEESKRSITIRVASKDKALEIAAAVGDGWDIDPLALTALIEDQSSKDQRELELMAALFMTSPEFRTRVQQMHGCLEELWCV